MLEFIKKFICIRKEYTGNRVVVKRYIRPKDMDNYISITDFEDRVRTLQAAGKIPQEYEEVASLYLEGVALWRDGKNPDDFF